LRCATPIYSNSIQAQGYSQPYYIYTTGGRVITDLDIGYRLNERLRCLWGANNLFNIFPTKFGLTVVQNLNYDRYSHLSPFGVTFGAYDLTLSVKL